jgi:hypothetical protein
VPDHPETPVRLHRRLQLLSYPEHYLLVDRKLDTLPPRRGIAAHPRRTVTSRDTEVGDTNAAALFQEQVSQLDHYRRQARACFLFPTRAEAASDW